MQGGPRTTPPERDRGAPATNHPAEGDDTPRRDEAIPCRTIVVGSCREGIAIAPAVLAASALGELHQATVAVTVAFEPSVPYPGASDLDAPADVARRVARDDREAADARLAHVQRELAACVEASWPVTMEVGQAPVAVVRAARRADADLIVLPLPTRAWRRAGARDSGAASVALYASVPVLAVSWPFTHLPTRLLFAVGLDPSIVHAAHVCRALLPPPEEVHMINVGDANAATAHAVAEQFDRVVEALALPGDCRVMRQIVPGREPWRALLACAARRRVDAIVAGVHGRTSMDRALVRNTALRILASGRRSALVVPGGPARERDAGA